MRRTQDWFVAACVFLFLSLASQFHCTSQTNFPNRQLRSKQEIGSSGDKSHFNVNRRVSVPSPKTTICGINQKKKDLIKKLPGQPPVSFRQYGGYVAINETTGRFFYYYFVEAIKANDSSPLVLWFNGGPGCSSLAGGALMEHGPFRVHSDGATLFRNPYSWNQEVNVLYLETPAKVGFSYTKTPSDLENQGDKMTAEDNYTFLVKWLERFPEYKGREVYITGQSYAGHYGPQLAQLVLHRNNQTFINLRGVLLGNPVLDAIAEMDAQFEFVTDYAMITKKHIADYKRICETPKTSDNGECFAAMTYIDDQKNNLDIYNIYAPVCLNSTLTSKPKKGTTIMKIDPCSRYYVTAYLNREKVQKAMHANTTKLPYLWKQCNELEILNKWNQEDINDSLLPTLHKLMGEGVRVWIYSGVFDSVIPVRSTMDVLKMMNLTVEKKWRQWFSGGELGGYTEDYKGNFKFITVREAGHSVPSDQPIRALTLFTSFIRNIPLPDSH